MTARYERRCRLLIRAYPPRYRQAREEELLSTLLDAAEPGRTAPSLREAWDLIRGGMTARWRANPLVDSEAKLSTQHIDSPVDGMHKLWLKRQLISGGILVAELFAFSFAITMICASSTDRVWSLADLALWSFPAIFLWLIAWLLPRRYDRRIWRQVVLGVSLVEPLVVFLVILRNILGLFPQW